MKRLYNRILSCFSKLPLKIDIFKTFIAEWVAIFRKKSLYKSIKWTKEQQKEFDEFWKKHYGKKISNRWHKLYEASNGVHRIDYLPEIIYSTKIEPKLNDIQYASAFSDKSLLDIFFDNRIDNVRIPKTIIFNNHGLFYDGEHRLISKQRAFDLLFNIGDAVIKPIVDSSSGRDVLILNIQEGKNIKDGRTTEELFEHFKSNFVVQEKIKPCKELATLYDGAINTLRITSYIVNDKIEVVPICLRVGSNGGEVDNIHAGGIGIHVKDDGSLSKFAYKLGYGDHIEKLENHPDTGVCFDGYKLEFIPEVVEAAKRLHELVVGIRVISWDFTVDEQGNIVIVEANYSGQGVWFPQMLSGESLFGKNTEKVLNFLVNKR